MEFSLAEVEVLNELCQLVNDELIDEEIRLSSNFARACRKLKFAEARMRGQLYPDKEIP